MVLEDAVNGEALIYQARWHQKETVLTIKQPRYDENGETYNLSIVRISAPTSSLKKIG